MPFKSAKAQPSHTSSHHCSATLLIPFWLALTLVPTFSPTTSANKTAFIKKKDKSPAWLINLLSHHRISLKLSVDKKSL